MNRFSYWRMIWNQFLRSRLGAASLAVVALFCLVGIYAPFLASSRPIALIYDGQWYFPLFRYLFYPGFFTKYLDIFFNLMIFTFPVAIVAILFGRRVKTIFGALAVLQLAAFAYLILSPVKDPASDPLLNRERRQAFLLLREKNEYPTFDFDLSYMTPYAKLNEVLDYRMRLAQHRRILAYSMGPSDSASNISTLWKVQKRHEEKKLERFFQVIENYESGSEKNESSYREAVNGIAYMKAKNRWLEEQNDKISFLLMPLIRPFHWEDDAGGDQSMNLFLPWWELTRINRKDLVAALIFGVRISLVVGVLAVFLAMCIGIPVGSLAGFYGGTLDIVVSRLLEIWESMPTFFMLLLVVAMTQSKSIFLVIAVVGIFGWTGFSRYIRGEFFKQRNLSYVEACRSLGFGDNYIMFVHILPNAIPPILTLLPFAIMGAITSEAGLSFLGLGEEGSCSWGVLMDEGRSAFPGESYLLWPPAILLTLLLVAIALVGDALRDALDPKMHH